MSRLRDAVVTAIDGTKWWGIFVCISITFLLMVYIAVQNTQRFAEIVANQHAIIQHFEVVRMADEKLADDNRVIIEIAKSHDALLKQSVKLWSEHVHPLGK